MTRTIYSDPLVTFRGAMRYRMEDHEMRSWPPPAEELAGLTCCEPTWADKECVKNSECVCGKQLMVVAMRGNGTSVVFAVCDDCGKCVQL